MGDLADLVARHRGDGAHDLLEGDGRGQPPSEAELAVPYAAPGRDALLDAGVIYQGDWQQAADGMARHTRAQVRALAAAGIPVALESISSNSALLNADIDYSVRRAVDHLRAISIGDPVIGIRQAVLHSPQFLKSLILPNGARLSSIEDEKAVYASTIVYTSWERDRVSPPLVEQLRRCAEVWVPCEANLRVFAASGVKHIYVVPYPYEPGTGTCQLAEPYGTTVPPSGKRFYHIGKWEPRKGQDRLLRCFLIAFRPGEATLFIKTHGWGSWPNYPTIEEVYRNCGRDPKVRANGWTKQNVHDYVCVVDKKVSDEALLELHRQHNIYVSASHGEAWDIPAFEAKCAGNRLVHVGFGGSEDYDDANDVRVPWASWPVDPSYGWEPGAQWAEYADESLVAALRKVEPPIERVHPPSFNERFSAHAVGELMKARVLAVAQRLGGDALVKRLRGNSYG